MRTVCLSCGSKTSGFPVRVLVSFSIMKFCYGYWSGPSKSMDTNRHDNMGQCGDRPAVMRPRSGVPKRSGMSGCECKPDSAQPSIDGGPDIKKMRLTAVATLLLSMVVFAGYSAPHSGGEVQASQDTLKVSVDLV